MILYVNFVELSLKRLNTCARIAVLQRRLGQFFKVGATSLILGISINLVLSIITGESVEPPLTRQQRKYLMESSYISGGIFGRNIIEELSNRRQEDQEKYLVYARMISTNTTWQWFLERSRVS
jgi:hypothetical protein